jgi:N-acetylmuramoyl-L-alanine amidase
MLWSDFPIANSAYTDPRVALNVRYYYAVTAINDLGMESAPSNVANAVLTIGVRTVTRLQGATRYDTAANIAKSSYPGWVLPADKFGKRHLIVACGEDRAAADPLAAAGLAGAYNAPVLLTTTSSLSRPTLLAIKAFASANRGVRIHIVGGPRSVTDALKSQMARVAYVGGVDRIGGSDRYGTTAIIAKAMADILGKDRIPGVLIVCSENPNAFYDALAASPIAFRDHMPMLGVRTTGVPASVRSALTYVATGKPRYVVSSKTYINQATYSGVRGTKRLTLSPNRYVASVDIAKAAIAPSAGWLSPADVGVASKLPDSLTGGAFMGARGGVLVFTDTTGVMQTAPKAFIKTYKPGIARGWIFGGPRSVTLGVESTFRNLLK